MADPVLLDNNSLHIPAQAHGGTHNDDGASRNGGHCFTLLTVRHSGNELWNMYLDEVKEDDKRIADAWKEGSSGILVFVSPNLLIPLITSMTSPKTGLFSAVVAAFIIEFYKQLSPNSGNQTVTFLANGTYSITTSPPSPPSASMIWVNAMWLISLVLSLTSALIATLLQEWARRYVDTARLPSEPNHRARVRWFLFLGTETYKMRLIVQMGFSLLHLSVYLFFAGLVVVFHTINKKVAIAVEVAVGLFGLAYIALSILPCLDVHCPYRTPMSYILWYPTHVVLSFLAICLRWLVALLHGCLVEPGLGDPNMLRQRLLVGWLESRGKAFETHMRYITDGLGKGIINSAIDAQDGDRRIVTRLFNLLAVPGHEKRLRRLAAGIPRDKVRDLVPSIESGRIVLQEPLRILLRSCAAPASGPDEEVRRRSLLVCLDAIRNIAKDPSVPDFNYMRANFANISLMRACLDSSDIAIRVTSRSICALLAKQVVREEWLEEPQLRWLQEVTGSRAVYGADADTRNRMNLKSFLLGVLSDQEGDLPTEDATSFKETLVILLDVEHDADFDTNFQTRLAEEVERIHQDDPEGSYDVVYKLRTMFLADPFPSLNAFDD
jgi:Family of unknown function (DUF6535)